MSGLIKRSVNQERKGKGLKLPSDEQVKWQLLRAGDSGALGVYIKETANGCPFDPDSLEKRFSESNFDYSDSDSDSDSEDDY